MELSFTQLIKTILRRYLMRQSAGRLMLTSILTIETLEDFRVGAVYGRYYPPMNFRNRKLRKEYYRQERIFLKDCLTRKTKTNENRLSKISHLSLCISSPYIDTFMLGAIWENERNHSSTLQGHERRSP